MFGFVLGALLAAGAVPQDTTLLHPDVVIGADESDPTTLFTFVVGLGGDASGNILVADMGGAEVSVFDSTGATVLKISAVGLGPGELQRPAAVASVGGEVVVFDVGHNAYLWFADDGEPVTRILNPFLSRLGLDPLHATPSGYVVDGTLGTRPENSFVVRRFQRSPDEPSIGPGVDSIVVRHDPKPAVAVGGATFIPVPMAPGTSWAVLGEDVIVSRNGAYVLERHSFDGRVDTLYARESNKGQRVRIPRALRRELAERFEQDLRAQAVRQGLPPATFLDEAEVPADFPPVLAIISDPGDRIWVLTGSASGEPALDLLDSAGTHLGTVRLQVDQWPNLLLSGIAASSSHLLLVAESALGTQVVQGFRIPDELRARNVAGGPTGTR